MFLICCESVDHKQMRRERRYIQAVSYVDHKQLRRERLDILIGREAVDHKQLRCERRYVLTCCEVC